MRSLYGIALAGALLVGFASNAQAQLSVVVGNPYGYGSGVVVAGNPYGYGVIAPGYGPRYPAVVAPGGYYGVAPLRPVYSSGYYGGYGPRPYGYGGYGGYGYRHGPYRRW